jgi:hypothetical protein
MGLARIFSTYFGQEGKMKYTAALLLMLSIGSCAQAQKAPEYETVKVTIVKIERVKEMEGETLWYNNKLVMRDSRGIIYKASARCLEAVPPPAQPVNSPVSCGHLAMPRIAETYPAKITFGGTLIYFGEILPGTHGFEIDSEEVSPRSGAK